MEYWSGGALDEPQTLDTTKIRVLPTLKSEALCKTALGKIGPRGAAIAQFVEFRFQVSGERGAKS